MVSQREKRAEASDNCMLMSFVEWRSVDCARRVLSATSSAFRQVVDRNLWLDRLWLTSPILFELWNQLQATAPFERNVRFASRNASAFELARGYNTSGMSVYVELQQREFGMEGDGYTATRQQREVGTGYFDDVTTVISSDKVSTLALKGRAEEQPF